MSDRGDKACPLCAEEMDLTDQQLKPCKCGYEICVWCWHQIMDMAEKDDTEGRCPACRTPYDKEKIVGMAANCERMVAEVNMERKKLQKSKTKLSEGRKQLSSMRVIQRNLVYIIGLPLTLADEDLLQQREYFGQYGKVLKVSLSRTAAGVVQQFPNNTCSVYITFSKEEEAIRCIQSVHGFVLDGRSLKACFGTTKYCHAWLRNVPCTNPDCLYLHEAGSQEDSFTKDEVISVYTRNRVQQITGVINNMLGRSGSMLPPPVDDYVHNTSTSAADPIVRSASKSAAVTGRGSTPNSSSGRSMGLPAAASWGTRPSNLPQTDSSTFLNGPSKPKHETASGTLAFSTAVVGITQASNSQSDMAKKTSCIEENQIIIGEGNSDAAKPVKQLVAADGWPTVLDKEVTENGFSNAMSSNQASFPLPSKYIECGTAVSQNCLKSHVFPLQAGISLKEGSAVADGQIQNLSEASLLRVESIGRNEFSGVSQTSSLLSEHNTLKLQGSQVPLLSCWEQYRKPSNLQGTEELGSNGICSYGDQSVWGTDPQAKAVADTASEAEEDVLMFDNQRLKDPEVAIRPMCLPGLVDPPGDSILSRSHSLQHGEVLSHIKANADNLCIENRVGDSSLNHSSKIVSVPNGYTQKSICSCIGVDKNLESLIFPNDRDVKQVDRVQSDADSNASFDIGESSIISNMLSLDLDSLDDSLTSPHNLVKLLGETDKQSSSLRLPTPRKLQTSNQSRFSFARQESSTNKAIEVDSAFGNSAQLSRNPSFSQDYGDSSNPYLERRGLVNGFSSEHDTFPNSSSALPSIKPSISRGQISAPPGFPAPNRTPPPGFSSHQRIDMDSNYDILSGNHLLDSSSIPRNLYRASPTGSFSNTGDIEFIDPAILAVGKGRVQGGLNNPVMEVRSNLPQQLAAFENEERLRLLMQGSLSLHQNSRHPDVRHGFSSLTDSFGLSTRLLDEPQVNNLSRLSQLAIQQSRNTLLSNGLYDDWNEVQVGSNLGMVELLRNERRVFNKFYNSGYEESKFRMPSSADLYDRTFEM